MRLRTYLLAALALAITMTVALAVKPAVSSEDIPRISATELKGKLGSPDLVIIDVRRGKDWTTSTKMIKGAVREVPADVAGWAALYDKSKEIVLYCA